MAPEYLLGQGYDFRVDCWALGVLVYELSVGCPPFLGLDTAEKYEVKSFVNNFNLNNLKNIVKVNFTLPNSLPNVTSDLISLLLVKEPDLRLGTDGIDKLKNHTFFKVGNYNFSSHGY